MEQKSGNNLFAHRLGMIFTICVMGYSCDGDNPNSTTDPPPGEDDPCYFPGYKSDSLEVYCSPLAAPYVDWIDFSPDGKLRTASAEACFSFGNVWTTVDTVTYRIDDYPASYSRLTTLAAWSWTLVDYDLHLILAMKISDPDYSKVLGRSEFSPLGGLPASAGGSRLCSSRPSPTG